MFKGIIMRHFSRTFSEGHCFAGGDALHNAEAKWRLEGKFNAFPLEYIREISVFVHHLVLVEHSSVVYLKKKNLLSSVSNEVTNSVKKLYG